MYGIVSHDYMRKREEKREERRNILRLYYERIGKGREKNRRETEGRRSKERVRARSSLSLNVSVSLQFSLKTCASNSVLRLSNSLISNVILDSTSRVLYIFPEA